MAKGRQPKHHSCVPGKRVLVQFKGEEQKHLDKFKTKENNSRYIRLEKLGRVALVDLLVFTIYRGDPNLPLGPVLGVVHG